MKQLTQQDLDKMVHWLKNQLSGCKAVIGISGGKDSTVVAALCARAIGPENVTGIMLPCGEQPDIEDSRRIIKYLGIKSHTINIGKAVQEMLEWGKDTPAVRWNVPPRVRMIALYMTAASLPHGRVINTSNASEAYVGWTTKWGDNVGDIYPILKFTKSEVVQLGHLLGLPADLVEKKPADGLSGKSDEDNLGFTYDELDAYIRDNELGEKGYAIMERHNETEHKRVQIVYDPNHEYI